MGYSVGAKALSVVLSLVSVPMALNYLGKEGYGLWATVTSFVGFLVFADLGVGNGMMNAVTNANAQGDFHKIRSVIASGAFSVGAVAFVLLSAFCIAWPFVNWNDVLAVNEPDRAHESAIALMALVIAFTLNMPASLIQKIQYGMQAGQWVSLSQGLSAVLNVLFIWFVIKFDFGLVGMVVCLIVASLTADLTNAFVFLRSRPHLIPGTGNLSTTISCKLLRVGMGFLFLQVSVALCYASDNLIVAHLLGHEKVAEYSVHQRLFSPILFVAGLALTPLWPAFADATARRDKAWIKKTLLIVTAVMLIAGLVGAGAVAIFSDWLLSHWLHGNVGANHFLAIGLAVWVTIDLAGRTIAMFLNGAGLLKEQIISVAIFVPLCIGLKLVLTKRYGLPGLVFGTAIAWTVVNVPAYAFILTRWARSP